MLKGNEISYIINDAEATMFVVEDALVDRVAGITGEMPSVKSYCSIELAGKPKPEGWLDFDELCSESSDEEPNVEIDYEDVFTLLYTSGTEAAPKGVMNTHLNWYSTLLSGFSDLHFTEYDAPTLDIPLYHVACIYVLLLSVALGCKGVMHYTVDPKALLEDASKEGITYLIYPPTLFTGLLQLPVPNVDEYLSKAFSTVKKCLSFGANMPEAIARRWIERILPSAYWMNYYGQTELTPLGTTLQHADFLRKIEREAELGEAIGKPHVTVEAKLVDEDDDEVPVGEVGEIVVRSPSIMLGYYRMEEKTKEAFRNGWLHTGDLARVDEEGYYYFVDRKKDIVKTGGENVSTYEVEGLIFKHPKVADVAVIGLPDPHWGEAVTAVVVPRSGETIKEEEIIEFCKKNLAGYKVPKRVFIKQEIPKNPSGKILKKDLKAQYKGKGEA
jgi:fatty-acyl-CoA synthase